MGIESSQSMAHAIADAGSCAQVFQTAAQVGLSTSVAASGTNTGFLVPTGGYRQFAIGLTSSQDGSLSVQRWLDAGGTIPQGPALTVALTAATAAVLNADDGVPFQALTVQVSNTGASAATITNFGLLFQAR